MKKIVSFIIIFLFTFNLVQAQWSELGGANSLMANNQIKTNIFMELMVKN